MNYYKRHLGDYAKKTRTLTVLQHGIYTLLLDLYYSEEAPVTAADAYAVCLARTAKDRAAVDGILTKFFTQDGEVWRNPKADEVIGKYHERAPKNAESGRLGGLAKAKRNASETLDERQPDADISHKPLTINQEKEKEKTDLSGKPDRADFADFWKPYPRKEAKDRAEAWWKTHKPDSATLAAMLAAMDWQRRDGCLKHATADGRSLIPLPASWLNGGRWKDERTASAPPPPPPRKIVLCVEKGCDGEGLPVWGGRCQVHHMQAKPARAAA